MSDGDLHPLAVMLGSEWKWLSDPTRYMIILLHGSGLWVELGGAFMRDGDNRIHQAIMTALNEALEAERTGKHLVRMMNGKLVTATLVPGWERPLPGRQARR